MGQAQIFPLSIVSTAVIHCTGNSSVLSTFLPTGKCFLELGWGEGAFPGSVFVSPHLRLGSGLCRGICSAQLGLCYAVLHQGTCSPSVTSAVPQTTHGTHRLGELLISLQEVPKFPTSASPEEQTSSRDSLGRGVGKGDPVLSVIRAQDFSQVGKLSYSSWKISSNYLRTCQCPLKPVQFLALCFCWV